MTNILKYKNKIIAGVVAFVMVFGALVFVSPTEAQAISLNATDTGFYNIAYGAYGETTFGAGTQIRVINATRENKNKSDAVYQVDGDMNWAPVDSNNYIVWDGSTDNTFYGVYPYNAEYDSFTIPTDQSDGVQDADWMTDDFTAKKSESSGVNLNFSHLLSKVTVRIVNWESEFGNRPQEVTDPKIYSKGTDLKAAYGGDGSVTITSTGEDIKITPVVDGTSYTAIVAPMMYNAGDDFMTFTVNGQTMTVKANDNAMLTQGLQAGKHYTFDLTVGKEAIRVEFVRVTPWTQKDIDGGVAEAVEVTTVINGTTATITVPDVATDAMVEEAIEEALDSGATTLILNGEISEEQQTAIATALADATGTILILPETTTVSETITSLTGVDLAYKNGEGANGYAVAADGTYLITAKAGLDAWRTTATSNTSTNLTLMCDIEYNASWSKLNITYTGTIDGNGYAIKGLNSSEANAALIQKIGEAGVVKHLGITGGSFYNTDPSLNGFAAAICTQNYGVIMGCYNTSSVTSAGNDYGGAGGLVAYNQGQLVGCFNSGTVQAGGYYGGGIAMTAGTGSKIVSCYNTGSVSGKRHPVGAIVGWMVGSSVSVSDCYYTRPSSAIGYTEKGTATNLTQVTGSDWTAAMNTMNAAIEEYNKTATVKCNYRYALNTDAATKGTQPLIIVEVAE